MCKIGTRVGPLFPKELGTNNSVSGLVLSNNLLYNLCSFAWESVHLEKSSSLKIICVEQKMIFPYIWHIKRYPLSLYLMNIINLECGMSLFLKFLKKIS